MAKLIDDTDVKMGVLIRVENTKIRFAAENELYVSLQVENEKGSEERDIFFTESQLKRFRQASSSLFDDMKLGRLYFVRWGKRSTYLCKVRRADGGDEFILQLTKKDVERADALAEKNPEDRTTKTKWNDFWD